VPYRHFTLGQVISLARRFPVFAIRDFRLLFADRLLAPSAWAFSIVGVSFAVLNTTGSTADLSYVLAAQIAPNLLFALVGGLLASSGIRDTEFGVVLLAVAATLLALLSRQVRVMRMSDAPSLERVTVEPSLSSTM
jgi:hypothetical protein